MESPKLVGLQLALEVETALVMVFAEVLSAAPAARFLALVGLDLHGFGQMMP